MAKVLFGIVVILAGFGVFLPASQGYGGMQVVGVAMMVAGLVLVIWGCGKSGKDGQL